MADPDAARLVEGLDPAALVEDHREGKEHREFEETWTCCLFDIAAGSGRIQSSCTAFRHRSGKRSPDNRMLQDRLLCLRRDEPDGEQSADDRTDSGNYHRDPETGDEVMAGR